MKHRDDTNSTNDPDSSAAAEQSRCRWSYSSAGEPDLVLPNGGSLARCPNPGWKIMNWGHGKSSWICEEHWDRREEMRPASPLAYATAFAGIQQILDGKRTAASVIAEMHKSASDERKHWRGP